MWRKKCKGHNWTEWDARWDSKKSIIWIRWCINCDTVEKSIHKPAPVDPIIQWLEAQMSSK